MVRCLLALGLGLVTACGDPTPSGPDAAPGLRVLAPNGGETLIAAEPVEVRWSIGPGGLPCDVALLDGAGAAVVLATGVTARAWTWRPSGVAAPTSFQIRVTATGTGGEALEDRSDAPFTVAPPAVGVSLARDVQPILTARCTTTFCHGAASQVAQLNLAPGASHAALVDVSSAAMACATQRRVRPGAPDQSYLLWKLAGVGPCLAGVRMPKGASPLTAPEVDLIRRWITEGAKDN